MKSVDVLYLGITDYEEAWRFQETVHKARLQESVPDTLILLQHPPVFTIGRAGKENNVLAPPWMLEREGIKVIKSDRGGDITYHGPGQLVVYPIIRLKDYGDDVISYVRLIEQTAIDLLAQYGIEGRRDPGYPGVWVGPAKLAAIGVAVRRGITMHGMAINVEPNLAHFGMINPCGLGKPVTSIARELGCSVDFATVQARYVECFATAFGVEPNEKRLESVSAYAQELTPLADS